MKIEKIEDYLYIINGKEYFLQEVLGNSLKIGDMIWDLRKSEVVAIETEKDLMDISYIAPELIRKLVLKEISGFYCDCECKEKTTKFENLEELLVYIKNKIIDYEDDRYVKLSIGDKEIRLELFENDTPILITREMFYKAEDFSELGEKIVARVDHEFLRSDLSTCHLMWCYNICQLIEENAEIFEKILGVSK